MFNNYYILLLKDKNKIINLYKQNIYFYKIKYRKDKIFLYVNEENYLKIKKYFKIYNISLYKIRGFKRYKNLLCKYKYFIFSNIVSLIIIIILSNIIFEINIMTDNRELIKIITDELKENNLVKYRFIKSFNAKERIKNRILKDYKDKIEWLEIERIGTKYYIKLLERKKNNIKEDNVYQNIVAKKNAIIMEIKSSKGEVVKKVYDYVNKKDVIISGRIMKNEDIKDIVKAEGLVYGETWYTVRVELPYYFHEKRYTGNSYNTLSLMFFDKRIMLFNKDHYQKKEYIDQSIISNRMIPFGLNKTKVLELNDSVSLYTYDMLLEKGMSIAREKLESNLDKDAKILSQKKLKLYEEDNIIVVEVFFKVYENITDYETIPKEGE